MTSVMSINPDLFCLATIIWVNNNIISGDCWKKSHWLASHLTNQRLFCWQYQIMMVTIIHAVQYDVISLNIKSEQTMSLPEIFTESHWKFNTEASKNKWLNGLQTHSPSCFSWWKLVRGTSFPEATSQLFSVVSEAVVRSPYIAISMKIMWIFAALPCQICVNGHVESIINLAIDQ